MLVLTRKPGEEIVLPDAQITITVLGAMGSKIRLGISAPRDVAVYRKELWDRMAFIVDAETAIAAEPVLSAEYGLPPR